MELRKTTTRKITTTKSLEQRLATMSIGKANKNNRTTKSRGGVAINKPTPASFVVGSNKSTTRKQFSRKPKTMMISKNSTNNQRSQGLLLKFIINNLAE